MRALVLLALPACYSIPPFAGPDLGGDGGADSDARVDARPSTHDEDGDGLFDDKDPCPHLPAVQSDSDQDGIGNDCELDPAASGELVRFYAFDGEPYLMKSGLHSQIDPDTYDVGGVGGAEAYLAPADTFRSVRIDIAFMVVSSPNSQITELGVVTAAADYRNDAGYGCFADAFSSTFVARDPSVTRDTKSLTAPVAGLTGTLSATRFANGAFTCTLTPNGGMGQTVTFTPTGSESGFVSVKAADLVLRLRYIYIVGRP
jgi:hypothetical protein